MIAGERKFQYHPILDCMVPISPPPGDYISLTAAMSWITFGAWVEPRQLYIAFDLANDELGQAMALQLTAKINDLLDAAEARAFVVRGKFANPVMVPLAIHEPTRLSLDDMRQYRCFDFVRDGLMRGTGLSWPYGCTGEQLEIANSDYEAYIEVSIERIGFINFFGAESALLSRGVGSQPKLRGRRKGSGYQDLDVRLLVEMAELLASGQAVTVHAAATRVAKRAAGVSVLDSKARRLADRFRADPERYGLGHTWPGFFSN